MPTEPLSRAELVDQVLESWRVNNTILLDLVAAIPEAGMVAMPAGSRGRDVRAQLAHLHAVRLAWLDHFRTGKRPEGTRYDKAKPPTRARLQADLKASGEAVEAFLRTALAGGQQPRMFGKEVVRWMSYLIAHDSHHRGQILLALKQSGIRIPTKVSMDRVWGTWRAARVT